MERYRIRALTSDPGDMQRIVDLEERSRESEGTDDRFLWTEDSFKPYLSSPRHRARKPKGATVVAIDPSTADFLGAMAFKVAEEGRVELVHILVAPRHRHQGVGSQLMFHLVGLTEKHGYCPFILVPETSLNLQLFLRYHGFLASKVLRNHFLGQEAAYHMTYARKAVPSLR